MKEKGIFTVTCICLSAICAVVLNRQSLLISYHSNRRLSEYHRMYDVGLPIGDAELHLRSFEYHQAELVRLQYFVYRDIPLVGVSVPSELSKRLCLALNSQTPIEQGYFEVRGYGDAADAVRLWGTPEQVSRMEAIIASYNLPRSATTPESAEDVSTRSAD